jgi:hypothetical protein
VKAPGVSVFGTEEGSLGLVSIELDGEERGESIVVGFDVGDA